MNQQIVSYIQQQLRSGYDINSIKAFLIQQGYNANEVEEAAAFLNQQRLSSLADYIKQSLSKGVDPDTLRSQLSASGYPMQDINDALGLAQRTPSKSPTSAILMVLVALVIFGLGLFFFWPSSKAGGTTSPSIAEQGTNEPQQTITFEKEPSVTETPITEQPTGEEAGQQFEQPVSVETPEDELLQQPEETTTAPDETNFASETSDFETLMDQASKETDAEKAMNICNKAENSMYKDACYDQLSKSFENSAICAKIEDEQLRDSCYLRIVLKNKDYTLCENIVDSSLYNSCVSMKDTPPAENMTMEDFTA